MSGSWRETQLGGTQQAFKTTCWTQILSVKTSDEEREKLIINDLLERYWEPVYRFLRHQGHSVESAKDMTQGFFTEIVLQRELFQQADPQKGRFRSLLLTALKRYVTSLHRYETAGKRRPNGVFVPLEDLDPGSLPDPAYTGSAEDSFNHAWIGNLLEQVLADVEQECRRTHLGGHWQVFEARILNPLLTGKQAASLPQLCQHFDIKNESQASNMITTVKRRLQKALARNMEKMGESSPTLKEQVEALLGMLQK